MSRKETPYEEWRRVRLEEDQAAGEARRNARLAASAAAKQGGPEAYARWLREQRKGRCR